MASTTAILLLNVLAVLDLLAASCALASCLTEQSTLYIQQLSPVLHLCMVVLIQPPLFRTLSPRRDVLSDACASMAGFALLVDTVASYKVATRYCK